MSQAEGGASLSRHPQPNSANQGSDAEDADLDFAIPDGLPKPEERVEDVIEAFPDLAYTPLSEVEGRELRAEVIEEERVQREVETDRGETVRFEEVRERTAVPMAAAVQEMLEWHATYHRSGLELEYGRETDPTHEEMIVSLDNSWTAEAQNQERARLKGMERETCGFESCEECSGRYCEEPDEHDTEWVEGAFEEPVVVLMTRTAAGDGRPPVDHARDIADAWTNGGVRRSLRYVMDKLDLENHEWVRWTQGEPHPGDKAGGDYGGNTGYHHAHDIIILDGAAADGDVTAATFREVIESHVSACPNAGPEAHDLLTPRQEWREGSEEVETVEVKEVDGEIEESVASYAGSYLGNNGEDLLERSEEYLVWAASMWATATRKTTGTDSRTHAITADRCKHNHEVRDQDELHGEKLRRSDKRGYELECRACGSPWGVEQDRTLAEARLSAGQAVADGGEEDPTREEIVEENLRDRWPSARESACVETRPGESHGVDDVTAGVERAPTWRVTAILVNGERRPAGTGGVDRRPLKLPGARLRGLPDGVRVRDSEGGTMYECAVCGFTSGDPDALASDGFGHRGGNRRCQSCVDADADTVGEIRPDVALMWPDQGGSADDSERVGQLLGWLVDDSDAGAGDCEDGRDDDLRRRVRRLVDRLDGEATVPRVAGELLAAPERVAEILEGGPTSAGSAIYPDL